MREHSARRSRPTASPSTASEGRPYTGEPPPGPALGASSAAARRRRSSSPRANILLCGIGLPLPPVAGDLNGIRIGTQEVTRFGLKEAAMTDVARFIGRFLVKGEAAEGIRRDVIAFRRDYQQLHFVR